jgi:hypothetical protein
LDQKDFSGDSPYGIMFGPDVCGTSTKRVHVIFTYKGKNLLTIHIRELGLSDKEDFCYAAKATAVGGITTVLDA